MCISVIKYVVAVAVIRCIVVVVVRSAAAAAGVCIIIVAYFPAVPAICIRCHEAYF